MIVEVIGVVPEFAVVNDILDPEPVLLSKPIAVLLLVQL